MPPRHRTRQGQGEVFPSGINTAAPLKSPTQARSAFSPVPQVGTQQYEDGVIRQLSLQRHKPNALGSARSGTGPRRLFSQCGSGQLYRYWLAGRRALRVPGTSPRKDVFAFLLREKLPPVRYQQAQVVRASRVHCGKKISLRIPCPSVNQTSLSLLMAVPTPLLAAADQIGEQPGVPGAKPEPTVMRNTSEFFHAKPRTNGLFFH